MAQTGSTFTAVVIGAFVVIALMPNQPAQQSAPKPEAAIGTDPQSLSTMPPPSFRPVPVPTESAAQPRQMMTAGAGHVSLQRAPDSHFYVDAEVNGTTVRFLIDTGATGVVLAAADASRVGISGDDYTVKAATAGGEVKLMPVMAEHLALGPFSATNVPMLVAKDTLPISLLGQSYLSRIGSLTISGDTMTLQ